MTRDVLREQIEYYRARAGEYDDWFYRKGRYDRGPEPTRRWFAEAETARAALHAFAPAGEVLELAAGTGIWTAELLRHADRVTAVDASAETLAINRDRNGSERVRFLCEDIFAWKPDRRYDAVFFGFWLSHVPPERFEAFWELVGRCLRPGGRVFFVDSGLDPTSTARDHEPPDVERSRSRRKLDDGREFTIVKVFHDPGELEARLRKLGWAIEVRTTGSYFLYGSGGRPAGGVIGKEIDVQHARGEFTVKITPVALDGPVEEASLGRMSIEKEYHGDLEGTAAGQMLTATTAVEGSAAYVAIERVSGTLQGQSGTFALQHRGTMSRGEQELQVVVVPDSGTGGLEGLTGTLRIIIEGGRHGYVLEYSLPGI